MIISQKQQAANRRNALLSTGPATPEGKEAVRLNALRYGLRARSILLPDEKPEDFHRLCADLEAEWSPQNRTEQLLLEQMVVAQWKLARLEVGERSIFAQQMPAERQMALLDRFSTQCSRLERSFNTAMHELRQLQKTHPERQDPAPRPLAPAPGGPRPPAPAPGGTWQQPAPPLVMAPAPSTLET